jgi:imidazolonepropionase
MKLYFYTCKLKFLQISPTHALVSFSVTSVSSVAVGKKMDLLLMDIPDYSYLAYHLGINPVHTVIKSGEVVVKERRTVYE